MKDTQYSSTIPTLRRKQSNPLAGLMMCVKTVSLSCILKEEAGRRTEEEDTSEEQYSVSYPYCLQSCILSPHVIWQWGVNFDKCRRWQILMDDFQLG